MKKEINKRERFGPMAEKVLLLLAAGALLSISHRPNRSFKIISSAKKEWERINERYVRRAIQKLYQSKLIDCKETKDGSLRLTLTEHGKTKQLEFNLVQMTIKTPRRWDGLWRIVLFDIPEHKKKARDALAFRLKAIGMKPLQKSVFVHPYDCYNEVEFLIELFDLRPYVRFVTAKSIDNELHLKRMFALI